jgi:transcriptional antiterminator RfaH
MSEFRMGWYLIYTRPRHEKKINSQLADRKINSYLPTRKVLRTWHDRKKYIEEPLFPSYVFVYLNDLQNFYEVLDVSGALNFVKAGKDIVRVNDTVVNNIRMVVDSRNEIEVSVDNFQPGQKLLITQGPLTGLSCEVIRHNGIQKIIVRVDLLQRSLTIKLPVDYVMAALI